MAKKKKAAFTRAIPKGKRGKALSGTMVDKRSGKKVFSREYKSGQAMSRAAAGNKNFGAQIAKMQGRLARLDSGKVKGKPGQRSFLRGALSAVRKAAPPQKSRSSGT